MSLSIPAMAITTIPKVLYMLSTIRNSGNRGGLRRDMALTCFPVIIDFCNHRILDFERFCLINLDFIKAENTKGPYSVADANRIIIRGYSPISILIITAAWFTPDFSRSSTRCQFTNAASRDAFAAFLINEVNPSLV